LLALAFPGRGGEIASSGSSGVSGAKGKGCGEDEEKGLHVAGIRGIGYRRSVKVATVRCLCIQCCKRYPLITLDVSYSTRSNGLARFIPTLDGWRGVGILVVLACHALEPNDRWASIGFDRYWHTLLYKAGPLALSVFFGLSGYLITTRLVLDEAKNRYVSLSDFYLRRAFRILPAAGCYLAVVGMLASMHLITVYRGELLSSLLFFRNYWPNGFWYTGHFWSLAVEEHFYLVWPLLFAALGSRRAACVGAILVVATVLWRPFGSTIDLRVPLLHRTDLRADALLFPSVLAIVLAGNNRLRDKLRDFLTPRICVLTLLVLLAALFFAPRDVDRTLQSFLVPMVVLSTALSPEGFLGQVLEWGPLTWLGRVSYSLYLWQQLFLSPGLALREVPLRLAGVFAVGCLSYYLVEKPAIRLARRFEARLDRRTAPATTDPVAA